MGARIKEIQAREILSAGAFPTVETVVTLDSGISGVASVPFGTSAGTHEAFTLVDGDPMRYNGKGMLKAIVNVNTKIAPELIGFDALDQNAIDEKLISLDPSPQRKNLGGNAILSVSLSCARAAATATGAPLYRYIRDSYETGYTEYSLPRPMVVVIEGGRHADDSTDIQEYLVGVTKDRGTRDNVRAAIETYFNVKTALKSKGYNTNVGQEGAFAPTAIKTNEEPLEIIAQAIQKAGYAPGEEVGIAMDPAASEFYHDDGLYHLDRDGKKLTSEEMIAFYEEMVATYPIFSIEDGLSEDDWDNWPTMTNRLGEKIFIVGDDLTVTNVERLQKAIDLGAINAILIKPNQVGTLTETVQAILLAQKQGFKVIVSHRGGGETTDTLIIDLASATNADYVKVGPSRGERVIKYNRLMEIGDELGL